MKQSIHEDILQFLSTQERGAGLREWLDHRLPTTQEFTLEEIAEKLGVSAQNLRTKD